MPALVDQSAIVGPLSAADLDRVTNTGSIWRTEEGEYLMPAEACTEVGHTEPKPKQYRTLLALCLASWAIPVGLLSLATWLRG